jgi:aspartate/glutamate racemase
MGHRIGLIHAVTVAIEPVQAAFKEIWPTADCIGIHDDSLSLDRERDGELTDAMCSRIQALADYATLAGAQGILYTCSAFGEAIDRVAAQARIPVLKPNQAMFEAALDAGDRIAMVATFPPAMTSMGQEFREAADRAGRSNARLDAVCVPEAMAALRAGDADSHNRLVAEAASALGDHDAILLAHFSTSRALPAVSAVVDCPVLTSPNSAVMRLRSLIDPID